MRFEDGVIVSKDWNKDNQIVFISSPIGAVPMYDQVLLRFRSGKKALYNIISISPMLSPNKDFEFKHYISFGTKWWKCLLKIKGVVK